MLSRCDLVDSKVGNAGAGDPTSGQPMRNKVEEEALDGGARKENARASGDADADHTAKDDDEDNDGEGQESEPGKNATVHSELQQELDREIEKKPKKDWGVVNPARQNEEAEAAGKEAEQGGAGQRAGGKTGGQAGGASGSEPGESD